MKDITKDQEALNYLVEHGFQSVPVTRIGDEHVVGFDPEKLGGLLA